MNRYLAIDEIRAVLVEDNSSDEEKIGSKEDDDEKNIINESDHVTNSEIKIYEKISILIWMLTLKALKAMIMMTNILCNLISFVKARSTIKILPADIQGFFGQIQTQQANVIDEPSPKFHKSFQLCAGIKNRVTTKKCSFRNDFVGKEHSTNDVQCITCASSVLDENSIANDKCVPQNLTICFHIQCFVLSFTFYLVLDH